MSGIGLAAAAARIAGSTGAGGRLILAGGPLIGRRAGQRLARHELAELSFWQRVGQFISRLLAGNAVPGGWFGLIALAVLAVLAITVVIFWVRPARTSRSGAQAVLGGESMTARDYRRAAERMAAAGDYAGAIVEGVRAIAAELGERDILPPRPGRTAAELAAEAGLELPEQADDLRDVTRLFDGIRYGDKDGSQAGYRFVRQVDEKVRAARPAEVPAAQPAMAGFGVPR